MPKPRTKSWICDACGRPIRRPDHGWVEWVALPGPADAPRIRDVRLVHCYEHSPVAPGACQLDAHREDAKDGGTIGDCTLTECLGPDGLTSLLEMIAEHPETNHGLLELVKRLHIPGYEHARRHFKLALAEGVIEPTVTFGYWHQDEVRRVLEFARSQAGSTENDS